MKVVRSTNQMANSELSRCAQTVRYEIYKEPKESRQELFSFKCNGNCSIEVKIYSMQRVYQLISDI